MALSSYITIADAVAVRLAQVTNIGKVHTFQRNINKPEVFKEKCFDPAQGRIATWMLSRESRSDRQAANVSNEIQHAVKLRGYMAVEDNAETELIFQKVVDAVCEAFRPQTSLGGIAELILPVQVPTIAYIELHGVLCHYAECTLTIQEYISA
jgi:hypothetical protein